MIKIIKFDNVYGIKTMANPALIHENTLIYAPNGVMKTSFSDGLLDIANGKLPQDIFVTPPVNADIEVESDGHTITTPIPGCLNIVSLKTNQNGIDLFNDETLSPLVMSPALKLKYKSTLDKIGAIQNTLQSWLSTDLMKLKKSTETGWLLVKDLLESKSDSDVIQDIPDLSAHHSSYYSSLPFPDIFNDDTEVLFRDTKFSKMCQSYQTCITKKLDENVFSSGFGMKELLATKDNLIKDKFFAAKHKIHLNKNEEMDQPQLEAFIERAIKDAYESEEAYALFEDAKKKMEKKKNRNLTALVTSDKKLLAELANPDELKKKIIFSVLAQHETEIISFKSTMGTLAKDLAEIVKEAGKTREIWNVVLEKYNNRFVANKLDVSISNQLDAVLGLYPAKFVKKLKGTNTEATDAMLQRFSSGEKRALLILTLMYEVELKGPTPFTLLLDDIADSFDYKNKYAIIECLKDFSKKSNLQLIILTHNFDFYRAVKTALGDTLKSRAFAYTDSGKVTLFEVKSHFFDDYSYFNCWKKEGKYSDYLALIPLMRNLAQLKENGKCAEYIELTKYLHYSSDTETIDLSSLTAPLSNCHAAVSLPLTVNYWSTLKKEISLLLATPPKETDLKAKVLFGIFIRLSNDRFMWKTYEKLHGVPPTIVNDLNQSRELFDLVERDLKPEENAIVQTAMTIAPSFVHLNSFMYEPLIDVGGEKFLEVSNKLIAANSTL